MVSICYYISDYGFGHASRAIAIIRRILNKWKNVKIYVKTDYPSSFVEQSLPEKTVEVIKTRNDIGVIFEENSTTVDKESTEKIVNDWVSSWNEYIREEKKFCKRYSIDLILSDITPQSFIVADELGVPGVAISNFTWYYIFSYLFGKTEATESIKEAYRCADIALVLPFNEDMGIFKKKKEVSLVARKITADRSDLRRKHGIQDSELLIYIGVGRSFNPSFLRNLKEINNKNIKLLVSSNVKMPLKNIIRIPDAVTETQNYIAMCNLIVSKTGYSTVSEAIRARVPMFLFKRKGYKEDEIIGNKVEELGIGQQISGRSFLDGDWIGELDELDKYKAKFDYLDGRFRKDGTLEVLEILEEVVL